jgi:voltage-gated potassium channel
MREFIGRQRMERDIGDLRDHIILCGYGRFGEFAAAELSRRDSEFAVAETDPDRVALAEQRGLLVLRGDATEEDTLRRLGIEHARAVLSALATDADNVYVALTAKEIRPTVPVIALAREERAESKLRAAGADAVVSPYVIGARNMARRILQPHVSDMLDSAAGVQFELEEVAVRAGSPLVQKALRDTPLRSRFGVTVVAVVKTREGGVRYNPAPDLVLEAGDVLVVVGSPEGVRGVEAECARAQGGA